MKEESESLIRGGFAQVFPIRGGFSSSNENYLKSICGSVSHCLVILRTAPHWPVRMRHVILDC